MQLCSHTHAHTQTHANLAIFHASLFLTATLVLSLRCLKRYFPTLGIIFTHNFVAFGIFLRTPAAFPIFYFFILFLFFCFYFWFLYFICACFSQRLPITLLTTSFCVLTCWEPSHVRVCTCALANFSYPAYNRKSQRIKLILSYGWNFYYYASIIAAKFNKARMHIHTHIQVHDAQHTAPWACSPTSLALDKLPPHSEYNTLSRIRTQKVVGKIFDVNLL